MPISVSWSAWQKGSWAVAISELWKAADTCKRRAVRRLDLHNSSAWLTASLEPEITPWVGWLRLANTKSPPTSWTISSIVARGAETAAMAPRPPSPLAISEPRKAERVNKST